MTIPQSSPRYWDSTAQSFDTIYSGQKSAALRLLDRWLRRDIYDRIEETVKIADGLGPRISVLDVGTGSGRLCIPLAQAGHRVTGVDFSRQMLGLASELTRGAGVADSCTFVQGDLLTETPAALAAGTRFDLVACLGVVDYIADVAPMLARMAAFNPKKIVVTYPKAGTLRSRLRVARYQVQRLDCPLYFYEPDQIARLGAAAGYPRATIQTLGELYFTVHERAAA